MLNCEIELLLPVCLRLRHTPALVVLRFIGTIPFLVVGGPITTTLRRTMIRPSLAAADYGRSKFRVCSLLGRHCDEMDFHIKSLALDCQGNPVPVTRLANDAEAA